MAGFYREGERKNRPGVYIKIVNIGDFGIAATPYQPPYQPPTPAPAPDDSEEERVMLLVNAEGVLYPVGPALSLGGGGVTAIVADAVNATVYGETIVVNNAR